MTGQFVVGYHLGYKVMPCWSIAQLMGDCLTNVAPLKEGFLSQAGDLATKHFFIDEGGRGDDVYRSTNQSRN